jgi:hypothetical protein
MKMELAEEINNIFNVPCCELSADGWYKFWTAAVGCQHYATQDVSLRKIQAELKSDDEFKGIQVRTETGVIGYLNKKVALVFFQPFFEKEIEMCAIIERFGRFKTKLEVWFRLAQTNSQVQQTLNPHTFTQTETHLQQNADIQTLTETQLRQNIDTRIQTATQLPSSKRQPSLSILFPELYPKRPRS